MVLKTPAEIELMDEANRIIHRVLDGIEKLVAPGVTTRELDRFAEAEIRGAGAIPAFLNYRGFPATLCTSVNDVIIHGIPGDLPLAAGDIVGVDCGVIYKGYYGDAARTFAVGTPSPLAEKLLAVTRESLHLAVEKLVPGGRLSDVGAVVQRHVERHGFSVVREFVGHGIGTALHEEPQVPNYGRRGSGILLKQGMALAIEPMVNQGDWKVRILEDGWTIVTEDGSLSAHAEQTVVVTDGEPLVLTA